MRAMDRRTCYAGFGSGRRESCSCWSLFGNCSTDWVVPTRGDAVPLSQGVRLVSVRQEVDFASTTGLMVASLLFGLSQSEMETRRTRQRAGIEAAKRRGVYRGRRSGATKAKPGRAVRLREHGLSDGEIAAALGVSRRTVQRYLKAAETVTAK